MYLCVWCVCCACVKCHFVSEKRKLMMLRIFIVNRKTRVNVFSSWPLFYYINQVKPYNFEFEALYGFMPTHMKTEASYQHFSEEAQKQGKFIW